MSRFGSDRLLRGVPGVAAATFAVTAGIPAVLISALVIAAALDNAVGLSTAAVRAVVICTGLFLGAGLLTIWALGRRRSRWLTALTVVAGLLAAVLAALTVLAVRPIRFSDHLGVWGTAWAGAIGTLVWLLIAVAGLIELRTRRSAPAAGPRPWSLAAGIVTPLALLTGMASVVVFAVPDWMIRLNGHTSGGASAAPSRPSELTGGVRWQIDLALGAEAEAVPTADGLAVPTGADESTSAGMVMLDPGTGEVRWRFHLRGHAEPPQLRTTDSGRAVVVAFDGRSRPDELTPDRMFTLSADSGRYLSSWRHATEQTDPPVAFDSVPRGTNAAIAFDPSGRRMWTYRPERCADPRGVISTPMITVVPSHRCDDDGMDLVGLDRRTGERRWAVRDSEPSTWLVRDGSLVELAVTLNGSEERGNPVLRRRELATGEVAWSSELTTSCYNDEDEELVGSDRAVFIGSCSEDRRESTWLGGYSTETGDQLWRRDLGREILSLTAVDDRVLALTGRDGTCIAELIDDSGSISLLEFPRSDGPDESSPAGPDHVRCGSSAVHRIGDVFVLQLALEPEATAKGSDGRYRFIALN